MFPRQLFPAPKAPWCGYASRLCWLPRLEFLVLPSNFFLNHQWSFLSHCWSYLQHSFDPNGSSFFLAISFWTFNASCYEVYTTECWGSNPCLLSRSQAAYQVNHLWTKRSLCQGPLVALYLTPQPITVVLKVKVTLLMLKAAGNARTGVSGKVPQRWSPAWWPFSPWVTRLVCCPDLHTQEAWVWSLTLSSICFKIFHCIIAVFLMTSFSPHRCTSRITFFMISGWISVGFC